ncbi:hypothetical protein [Sphingomonas astaxanthinifaciens]|uniref:Terminase small subunit n=1 Tax=Sphingomonas astaxanthinifaciens DSM 22298 TaxID=1123267 RepID=A0ABQ5Z426_9SPHN|nr:hypothetical protein [Sphingomonas astaxanthinifaciens]GLR47549.1 hypothetical protein GCM10007925_12610 [Sphingomonas astaxanthinifaciens DSM 22298]
MQNRTPGRPNGGEPLPDFQPVARRFRHDGWTPERQRAFIAALADTGSVSRAAALVNMSPEGAYYLRRQAGAESFRRAWEAALDFGVQRLRDIAMERALTGELVPVMSFGKLVGYRRKTNDRLLMFILRMNSGTLHRPATPRPLGREGGSRQRRRKGEGLSKLSQPLLPTRLVSVGLDGQATQTAAERQDDQAALIRHFDPVDLSLEQIEALQQLLSDAAAEHRHRAAHPETDPAIHYLPADDVTHALESGFTDDETGAYTAGGEAEIDWRRLDEAGLHDQAAIDEAVARAACPTLAEQAEIDAHRADFLADLRRTGQHANADQMEQRWAQERARREGKDDR